MLFFCVNKNNNMLQTKIEKLRNGLKLIINNYEIKSKKFFISYNSANLDIGKRGGRVDDELVQTLNFILNVKDNNLDPMMTSLILIKSYISFYIENDEEL